MLIIGLLILEKIFKAFTIWNGGHLGHVTKTIFYKFMAPLPNETPYKILDLIGEAVSEEMFKNSGFKVNSLRVGTDYPLGSKFSKT